MYGYNVKEAFILKKIMENFIIGGGRGGQRCKFHDSKQAPLVLWLQKRSPLSLKRDLAFDNVELKNSVKN